MNLEIRHFAPWELQGWWNRTSPRLLLVTDIFRFRWRAPVDVSRHHRAIGRNDGPDVSSRHNIDYWGQVLAIDLQPRGMVTRADARRAVQLAIECGATGIAVYPHWASGPGLHLDVRKDRDMGDPARWGMVNRTDPRTGRVSQVEVSMADALEAFPEEA